MGTTISVPPQHAEHEWMGPAFFCGKDPWVGSFCICGAERWEEDGVEHVSSGWLPHPIVQKLGNPKWEALIAVSVGRACSLRVGCE